MSNTIKNTLRLLCTMALVSPFLISPAQADENSTWAMDKALLENSHLKNVSQDKECKIVWDVLWKWAKKDNLEARAMLSVLSFPAGAHAPVIIMPGAGDELSRRRSAVTLSVHSFGVNLPNRDQQDIYEHQTSMYYSEFLNDNYEGKYFLSCLKSKSQKECIPYAKDRIVPSFAKYAAEIDALLASGMEPQCSLRD